MYGLKENPRALYECLHTYLITWGLKSGNLDPCLSTSEHRKPNIYFLVSVDDLLICGENENKIKEIQVLLSKGFNMKDLAKIKEYLGIGINLEHCCMYAQLQDLIFIQYKLL